MNIISTDIYVYKIYIRDAGGGFVCVHVRERLMTKLTSEFSEKCSEEKA